MGKKENDRNYERKLIAISRVMQVICAIVFVFSIIGAIACLLDLRDLKRCGVYLDEAQHMLDIGDDVGFDYQIQATKMCMDDIDKTWHGRFVNWEFGWMERD